MPDAPSIRPYTAADRDAVVALWAEAFPDAPSYNDSAEMIARKVAVHPELFLVAEAEGVVVGAVMAGFDGVRGYLHRLAVRESARRRGCGRALVERAEAELARLGCPKIKLQVLATNQAVVAFYRALGYEVEERIDMGKRLNVG